ncbi:rhomboid family intramembrane serine protease [Hyalangium versicolor]|uniref:rhomboid family intramembrane serine protease n=1 Tax=Hyalangium versicolor TaxID=2861190 RepID=UPI001CCD4ECF|nr:rhomboid family intramembrane serine protease [Hyalangium versicolor]
MRPVRRFGGGGGGGLGIPGLESTAAKLALGLVVGSVLYLLTRNALGGLLLLSPVLPGGVLWQPFTYAFVEVSPLGIIFGALIIWNIGGWLEGVWGPKRMVMLALGCTVVAGFLTTVVMFLLGVNAGGYTGGTVMASILWVAYGLVIGRGQTNFWGIPLSGNAFAGIGAGFVVLGILTSPGGILVGVLGHLPEIFGLLLALGYVKGGSPRGLWLHFNHWRLQRQLRNRSRNLHVISSDRPDDRYLN